jgi:hypothetical protein
MNIVNEKDFSKSLTIKDLRNNNICGILKYLKSDFVKKSYPKLLFSSEQNILYFDNLINKTNSTYIKYHFKKVLIQHAELIKRLISKLEETLTYLCTNNKNEDIDNIKKDLLVLHFFEFRTYKQALIALSEIKMFYKNIHKYDIENDIEVLNFKTNLSGIEYVKAKLEYSNKTSEAKRVDDIIKTYKTSHDDNILNEIKEIEKSQTVESFENIKKNNNNYIFIILIILFIIFLYNKYMDKKDYTK